MKQIAQRRAGWLAIISGAFGIAAFAFLIMFLVTRPSEADQGTAHLLLRSHDAAVIFQSLCLIPLTLALDAIARLSSPRSSRVMAFAAVTFLAAVAVLVLLGSVKAVSDVLYMIPQGAVGVWLIAVCRQTANDLPLGLRRLGIVAGAGLILVSVFPIGYSLFVDPAILHGPLSDNDPTPQGTETADRIVHIALAAGTLVGCSTYPIWSSLVGRWLLLRSRQ